MMGHPAWDEEPLKPRRMIETDKRCPICIALEKETHDDDDDAKLGRHHG
jgi:hypothetical protein